MTVRNAVSRMSTDGAGTQQYAPKRARGADFGKTRNTAYTRAGIEAPKTQEDIIPVLLAAEATAADVINRVLAEATNDKELNKGIAELQRAQAADALKREMKNRAESIGRAFATAPSADVNEALAALSAFTTTATQAISDNAGALPDAAFDMIGVIEMDVSKQMKQVHTALGDLSAVASLLPSGNRSHLGSDVNDIAVVVEVPRVQPEQVSGIANHVHKDAESRTRDLVRRMLEDSKDGVDQVLVDVVRGVYGSDVKLSMVKDVAEYRQRVSRLESNYEREAIQVHAPSRGGAVVPASLLK